MLGITREIRAMAGGPATSLRDPKTQNPLPWQGTWLVGVHGLEPWTSSVSRKRSSQLSYTPESGEI
jgi:hypothetical protein